MKKASFLLVLLFATATTFAQSVYYGENIAIDSLLDSRQTVEYRATQSITLLPGFASTPEQGHSVLLNIGAGFGLCGNSSESAVYPVPATKRIYITVGEIKDKTVGVEVYNAKGLKCLSTIETPTDNCIMLDIQRLNVGLYLYKLLSNGKELTSGKFVKM